jgi:uncharacterized damage-inducible protein DinB
MSDLRYPIGRFEEPAAYDPAARVAFVTQLEEAPARLHQAVYGLAPFQLDTPYREGGWTVRQVVHHVADSHLNSYVRFKLAVTEVEPLIKPYAEKAWAELADSATGEVELSLDLLAALHRRWVVFLRSLEAAQFALTFRHPERGLMTLDRNLALYAWHGRHHAAHVTSLRERMGWS